LPDIENPGAIDFGAEAEKLRKHFEFTEADLMANQSGVLSEMHVCARSTNRKGAIRYTDPSSPSRRGHIRLEIIFTFIQL